MIDLYSTLDGKLIKADQICPGTWVHLTDPSKEELEDISKKLNVEMDFLKAALDEEETVRIESEDDQTL